MGLPGRYGWLQRRAGSIAKPLLEMIHFPCNERPTWGRYFAEFCEHTEFKTRLNDHQLKREGSFKDGYGGEVSVWTFKARKWRLYGAILPIGGRRWFVGTRVDASKKQDKADQDMLRRTAKDIGGLAEIRVKN